MAKDNRQIALKGWSEQQIVALGADNLADGDDQSKFSLEWSVVSGDASFRRYFRWRDRVSGKSWIAVDAPPGHENSRQFIKIARKLEEINAPRILASDLEQGFMLLTDLGDQLLWPLLDKAQRTEDNEQVGRLYRQAIDSLVEMQKVSAGNLPDYDYDALNTEMELFREWFLTKHLGLTLSSADHQLLDITFEQLIKSAHEQPQVFVHRDYHSRNIMHCDGEDLGIIDFQDAVRGPVTYDLVSLLRDCYIQWPAEQVTQLLKYFLKVSPALLDEEQFTQWFDWMGLQRHIKVAGIFCRLKYRDGKEDYLKDIPLTLTYIVQEAEKYPQMSEFHQWMLDKVLPAFDKKQENQS